MFNMSAISIEALISDLVTAAISGSFTTWRYAGTGLFCHPMATAIQRRGDNPVHSRKGWRKPLTRHPDQPVYRHADQASLKVKPEINRVVFQESRKRGYVTMKNCR
jgi:hypothetical protein